jgi:hypothetical protein
MPPAAAELALALAKRDTSAPLLLWIAQFVLWAATKLVQETVSSLPFAPVVRLVRQPQILLPLHHRTAPYVLLDFMVLDLMMTAPLALLVATRQTLATKTTKTRRACFLELASVRLLMKAHAVLQLPPRALLLVPALHTTQMAQIQSLVVFLATATSLLAVVALQARALLASMVQPLLLTAPLAQKENLRVELAMVMK